LKPERLDKITLIPGVVEAVARLSAAGFVCRVVTVQSRIAKGLFSLPDLVREFRSRSPSGINYLAVAYPRLVIWAA
jgi:beta-phosphoglucomutase-like phosphatase (HAD superfamily)